MTKGWDHDPPAKEKLVPFGVLMLATGILTLLFGTAETSDFWGDCLRVWWRSVRAQCRKVRRLVIYLDNGPKNSGSRTQFLKRMIEFADWSGLEIRLVTIRPITASTIRSNAAGRRCKRSGTACCSPVGMWCEPARYACTGKANTQSLLDLTENIRLGSPYPRKK